MSNQRKTKTRSGRRRAPSDAPVGVSEEQGPESARDKLRTFGKTAVGGAALLGLAFGLAFAVHAYLLRTPLFGATEIVVVGTHRLARDQVLSLSGLRLGQNVLSVDTGKAEQNLLNNPWIRSATVTRQLPLGMRLEIEERQARAKGVILDRIFLISETGEPFTEVESHEGPDLPLISGIDVSRWGADPSAEIRRLLTSVELLDEYEHSPLGAELAPEELHWDAAGNVVLTIGRAGTSLHLGPPPFRAKLIRAERVIADARAEGTLPAVIFLDNEAHPERVVVRAR